MARYNKGDVAKVIVPFSDQTGYKLRPTVILKVHPTNDYLIVECTSYKEGESKRAGKLILEGTNEFKEMGLTESSIINYACLGNYSEKRFRGDRIGFCSFIDDLISILNIK